MKYKTTRKAIVNGCARVKKANYCDLQNLLRNHDANAYTCGVYGWNFDVYEVYGLTICTGYRNMPGERLEGISLYSGLADKAWTAYLDGKITYEQYTQAIENLLREFCAKNGGDRYEPEVTAVEELEELEKVIA